MESLPAELLFDIYLKISHTEVDNLSLVSKYIRKCRPSIHYLHKIKFINCLKEISSMWYNTGVANFRCYGDVIGYCIIYNYENKYYHGRSISQEFPYSVRRYNNIDVFYIYNSEICVSTTNYVPRNIAKDCLTVIVSEFPKGAFERSITIETSNYGEMLISENCNKTMYLKILYYNIKNSNRIFEN